MDPQAKLFLPLYQLHIHVEFVQQLKGPGLSHTLSETGKSPFLYEFKKSLFLFRSPGHATNWIRKTRHDFVRNNVFPINMLWRVQCDGLGKFAILPEIFRAVNFVPLHVDAAVMC